MHTWELAKLSYLPQDGSPVKRQGFHLQAEPSTEYLSVNTTELGRNERLIQTSLTQRGLDVLGAFYKKLAKKYPVNHGCGFYFYETRTERICIYDCGLDMDTEWYNIFGKRAAPFRDVQKADPKWRPWNNKEITLPSVFLDTTDESYPRKDSFGAQWIGGMLQGYVDMAYLSGKTPSENAVKRHLEGLDYESFLSLFLLENI